MTALPRVHGLTDPELDTLNRLVAELEKRRNGNIRRQRYFEGRYRVQQLGIAVPPRLRELPLVVGWPGMAVSVLEERLDWQGVTLLDGDGDPFGLDPVIQDNSLLAESQRLGLGFSRAYPTPIDDIPELRGYLDGRRFPAARSVADRIFTVPTHPFVSARDRQAIASLLNTQRPARPAA